MHPLPLAVDVFAHWIEGHRLAFAASLLLDQDPMLAESGALATAEDHLAAGTASRRSRGKYGLHAIPLHALHALRELAAAADGAHTAELRASRALIGTAIGQLAHGTSSAVTTGCPLQVVDQVVCMIGHSNWGGEQIRRLLGSMGSKLHHLGGTDWRRRDERWDAHLARLREPWLDVTTTMKRQTPDRIAAIEGLRDLFVVATAPSLDWWAGRICDALIDRLYIWPLLVLPGGRPCWLPVRLEMWLDEQQPASLRITGSPGTAESPEWAASCRAILAEVRRLFTASRPPGWGGMLDHLQIELDTSDARRIAGHFAEIDLVQRSMEVYFVGAILSRLCGAPFSTHTVATGSIGDPLGNSRTVGEVTAIEAKLSASFQGSLFDRVLIAKGPQFKATLDAAREGDVQTASVVPVTTVRTAARIIAGLPLDPHRLLRCADLALQRRARLDSPVWESKRRSIEAVLRNVQGPVVFTADHGDLADITATDLLAYATGEARGLTSTFVRVCADEDDCSAWEMVGEALGASEAQIAAVLCAMTPSDVAASVQDMCRRTALPGRDPLPLVDWIVFVVDAGHRERYLGRRYRSRHTHSLYAVGPALEALRSPTLPRIFIVEAAPPEPPPEGSAPTPPWLEPLRIFRHSFDMGSAARVLGRSCRRDLLHAVALGHLARTSEGDFTLVHQEPALPSLPDDLSRNHRAAAISMLPSIAPRQSRIGLPWDEARLLHNLLEATYHLNQSRGEQERKEANQLLVYVRRFLRRQSLEVLGDRSLASVHTQGERLISWLEREHARHCAAAALLHPTWAVCVGNACLGWLGSLLPDDENFHEMAGDAIRRSVQLCQDALSSCERLPGEERDYAYLACVASVDGFAERLGNPRHYEHPASRSGSRHKNHRERASHAGLAKLAEPWIASLELDRHNAAAEETVIAAPWGTFSDVVAPEWLDRRARAAPLARTAALLAANGCVADPAWLTCWIIWLGARASAPDALPAHVEAALLSRLVANDSLLTQIKSFNPVALRDRGGEFSALRARMAAIGLGRTQIDWIEEGQAAARVLTRSGSEKRLSHLRDAAKVDG